jgi:Flp pilus assembly protein TadB
MSKERARRRAQREREAALKAAARQREVERRARARARKQALTGWVPRPHLTPGVLAARRRAELGATFGLLFLVNLVVWLVRPDWAARAAALVVSLVVFPVVRLMVSRR